MAQFFLWFFTALGWILLILGILLILLLVFPLWVALEVQYDRWEVRIHVLGFSTPVYPRPSKKKRYQPRHLKKQKQQREQQQEQIKEESSSAESQTHEAPQDVKKNEGEAPLKRDSWWSPGRVFEIITTSGKLMRAFLRVIRIRKVQLVLPVSSEDAAETAIQYGRIQASIGSALGVLQNYFEIEIERLQIIADFTGEYKYRRYFYCRIGATPFVLLAVFASVLWKAYRKSHLPSG